MHGAICDPTTFTSVCQRTGILSVCDTNRFVFITSLSEGDFPLNLLKLRTNLDAMDYVPVAIILVGKPGERPAPTSRKNIRELAMFVD